MKKNNVSILCTLIGIALSGASFSSNAGQNIFTCVAGQGTMFAMSESAQLGFASSPAAGDCGSSKNIHQFTGDAASQISMFGTEIGVAGEAIAQAISSSSFNEINAISDGNAKIIKMLATIANTQIKDQLNQDKMMLDMEMDYLTEMEERELKASQGVMGMDDTKEEVLFIINELENVGNGTEGNYNHSQEVIAAMKAKYDDNPEFLMPVRIKAAESTSAKGDGCAQYDPDAHKSGTLDGSCFYGVKANPGAKLEKYFQECSRLKAGTVSSVKKNQSKTISKSAQKKAQTSYLNKAQTQSSSELAQTKEVQQRETSCTVKEFGYKICGKTDSGEQISTEEYLKKVVDNEIVPYGNVSSSNYLAPVAVGTIDGDMGDITEEELVAMQTKSLNYKKIEGTDEPSVAASTNTPPIVNTYRTSSQYFAAIDFVDNLINKEAVTGMNVTRSTNSSNAMFQSKFMSRAASLSLAENSLRSAISLRTGSSINEKIEEEIKKGDEFDRNDEIVKEDINGAGPLDVITHLVDKDYNRLQGDAETVISGGGVGEINTAPNKVNDWQVEALIKSNQLALMRLEQNERMELLLAAMLANTANSEKNVNYINSLRLK